MRGAHLGPARPVGRLVTCAGSRAGRSCMPGRSGPQLGPQAGFRLQLLCAWAHSQAHRSPVTPIQTHPSASAYWAACRRAGCVLICVRRGHTAQHTPAPTARGGKSEQTKMHFYSFLGPYINSCGSTHTRSDGEGRPRSAAVTRLATTTPPMANTPRCDSEKSPPPHRARRKYRRRRSPVSKLTRKIEDVTQRNRRRRRSAASRLTRRNRRCDSAKSPSQPIRHRV